ncbi:hypothetical protein BaRGS_00006443 [Batillaria attramentaria]|uniref:Uncharacterized protein n=1 Tax=Batillaria attramentaria TaxID=370345 RepID=A0ABD0LSD0_9CAEN
MPQHTAYTSCHNTRRTHHVTTHVVHIMSQHTSYSFDWDVGWTPWLDSVAGGLCGWTLQTKHNMIVKQTDSVRSACLKPAIWFTERPTLVIIHGQHTRRSDEASAENGVGGGGVGAT